MGNDRRLAPLELLRQLALSLEGFAVQGVASGAVRGAAEGLQAELPNLDGALRQLVEDALTVIGRLAHECAERPAQPPGTWPRIAAEGAMRGLTSEFKRANPELQTAAHEVLKRLNVWLERSAAAEAGRLEADRTPGSRARVAAAGAIEGAVSQLGKSRDALAPLAEEVAARAARGFVHAFAEALDEEWEARRGTKEPVLRRAGREVATGLMAALAPSLKRPLAVLAGAGGALVVTGLVLLRSR
ncbi:hypothetical protein JGU66_35725 [Myxococcaceae bacterium JPH2]|nr:hypothetical protein [Myxococcaceae bacterium JPH2]